MEQQSQPFRDLVKIIIDMASAQDTTTILEILLDGALKLVKATNGSIARLDYRTGKINVVHSEPYLKLFDFGIDWGQGIMGKALIENQPQIVEDIASSPWCDIYIEHWEHMRSEITVPIVLENIPVRIESDYQNESDSADEKVMITNNGVKRIGVLNIESSKLNAFSKEDEEVLLPLARYAAIRIDAIEFDRKLAELRIKEKEITESGKEFDQIIETVINSIIEILDFEVINISLVDLTKGVIETKYVEGIAPDKKQKFMKEAVHSLDSMDIQASIVREGNIEVPKKGDPRLDVHLAKEFNHDSLIRVFIPMIEGANNQVIGTLEAGYRRAYRRFIYERDVRILESFVNHAVQALEKIRAGLIDQVTHEIRNPIVGIRNHLDILIRRRDKLREDEVQAKLDDMLTDCAILFYQVQQLEVMMGAGSSQDLRIYDVVIGNEITKVVKQLKPLLKDKDFPLNGIEYHFPTDSIKYLKIKTDKAKLNQVIYNLLINAIKYAKNDPDDFRVSILMAKNNNGKLMIKIKDNGIGIEEHEKEQIFHRGFRSDKVKSLVIGSGMGLSISRDLITKLGGELILARRKPATDFQTEFQIIMPCDDILY
jgi:signal transduction histidine kinase/putative methionine-R-sulfoxide reductase with GAF domain